MALGVQPGMPGKKKKTPQVVHLAKGPNASLQTTYSAWCFVTREDPRSKSFTAAKCWSEYGQLIQPAPNSCPAPLVGPVATISDPTPSSSFWAPDLPPGSPDVVSPGLLRPRVPRVSGLRMPQGRDLIVVLALSTRTARAHARR